MYVYIQSERRLWTVGHYEKPGEFVPESDHASPEKASERVAYLNGTADSQKTLNAILDQLYSIENSINNLKR